MEMATTLTSTLLATILRLKCNQILRYTWEQNAGKLHLLLRSHFEPMQHGYGDAEQQDVAQQ